MIELSRGLSPRALEAISALEARTVAADGGRLKLEWGTLRGRSGERAEDILWWRGDQLLGFLGLYSYDGRNVELAGMVDPAARRQGIATALLEAALTSCRERAFQRALRWDAAPSSITPSTRWCSSTNRARFRRGRSPTTSS